MTMTGNVYLASTLFLITNASLLNAFLSPSNCIQTRAGIGTDANRNIPIILSEKKKDWDPNSQRNWDPNSPDSWLRRVENRVHQAPVGEIDPSTLKQVHPVMSAWARRRSIAASEKAEKILMRLIQDYESGNKNVVLKAKLFNAVMDGWAKCGDPIRAQKILRLLKDVRTKNNLTDLVPTEVTITTLVDAWAKSENDNAASRAMEILSWMRRHDMTPKTITYNTVLNALSKSKTAEAKRDAELLVEQMEELGKQGKDECRPDVKSYQCLISAWSRSDMVGAPQRAQDILFKLDEEYSSNFDERLKPNGYCFGAVLNAWSKSREPEKAQKAYITLQYMRKRYEEGNESVKPNTVAYTSVLKACSYPLDGEEEEFYRIACLVMEELHFSGYAVPNFLTYATFFAVCRYATGKEEKAGNRDDTIRYYFHQCCREGQVGQVVIEKLKLAASPSLYEELLGEYIDVGVAIIPHDWNRNVVGEKRNKRKSTRQKPTNPVPTKFDSQQRAQISTIR